MDATPQRDHVIQSLRVGDLVGHRQQPEQRYEVLTVAEQRLLVARWPGAGAAVYCVAGCGGAVLTSFISLRYDGSCETFSSLAVL